MLNNLMLNFYEMLMILTVLINMILILMGVAFNTLLERKILGYIQFRKGPNKVSFNGVFQPFSDAIKLYSNEFFMINNFSSLYFYISPLFMLFLMLLIWMSIPIMNYNFYIKDELLMIFCCLSMGSYPIIMSGWSSYSNYALIGVIRAVSQMISYEVIMILIILSIMLFNENYSLIYFIKYQELNKYIFMFFILLMVFFTSMLAELNRSPFDLIEGESELVSGFNIEYMSGLFGLIFMSEYGMIMFSSFMLVFMFMGFNMLMLLFYLIFFMINYLIIWCRGVLPRMRYDELMMLCWKYFLLMILIIFYYNFIIKMIYEILWYMS